MTAPKKLSSGWTCVITAGCRTAPRYFAPLGEIRYDPDEDRVQCHLCGRWYRVIAGSHLQRVHGWTLEDYAEAFRLPKGMPTVAAGVSAALAAHRSLRLAANPVTTAPVSSTKSIVWAASPYTPPSFGVEPPSASLPGRCAGGDDRLGLPLGGLVGAGEHGGVEVPGELGCDRAAELAPQVPVQALDHLVLDRGDRGRTRPRSARGLPNPQPSSA